MSAKRGVIRRKDRMKNERSQERERDDQIEERGGKSNKITQQKHD